MWNLPQFQSMRNVCLNNHHRHSWTTSTQHAVMFDTKLDTDLYEFGKTKLQVHELCSSPDVEYFVYYSTSKLEKLSVSTMNCLRSSNTHEAINLIRETTGKWVSLRILVFGFKSPRISTKLVTSLLSNTWWCQSHWNTNRVARILRHSENETRFVPRNPKSTKRQWQWSRLIIRT